MPFRLVIVGRPNVGKSTLFNRFAKKKLAIVHDEPGVTRDWKEAPGQLSDLRFTVVDTAGIEKAASGAIPKGMRAQTEAALKQADAVLFMLDGREGLTGADREIAQLLRKTGLKIILVANKCEGSGTLVDEMIALGFGDPIQISAEHNQGMGDLYEVLSPLTGEGDEEEEKKPRATAVTEDGEEIEQEDPTLPIRIAIVGRPNAGKSTLLNTLLGETRSLVSAEAGTTRDPVVAKWEWQGREIRLVDTAGLRKKAKVTSDIEKMAIEETLRIIRLAEVVVIVVDATAPLEDQDLQIAALALKEGRALVLALNKWDLVQNPSKTMSNVRGIIEDSLPQASGLKGVPISALKGQKLDTLMKAVIETHKAWTMRISTSPLNRWLELMVQDHQPPLVKGKRVKIRYMTQRKGRPPTFVLFCGSHAEPPDAYIRYLVNGLRQRFELPAVPIRFEIKKNKSNPYEKKKLK